MGGPVNKGIEFRPLMVVVSIPYTTHELNILKMRKIILIIFAICLAGTAKSQEVTITTSKQLGKMSVTTMNTNDDVSVIVKFYPSDYMKNEMKGNKKGVVRPIPVPMVSVKMTGEEYDQFAGNIMKIMEFPLETSIKMSGPVGFKFSTQPHFKTIKIQHMNKYMMLSYANAKKL